MVSGPVVRAKALSSMTCWARKATSSTGELAAAAACGSPSA